MLFPKAANLLLKENGLILLLWDQVVPHLFCERVYFSKDFWDTTFPKLESFFNCWIMRELAYLCVKYALPKLNASSFRVL